MKPFRVFYVFFCLLSVVTLLSSCSDDDGEVYPRLRVDFYDVIIDGDSTATSIILDDGRTYAVSNSNSLHSTVCDTVIRCYGTIEIGGDSSTATVYSVGSVRCSTPSHMSNYGKINYNDTFKPVDVISLYKARSYINVLLTTKVSGNVEHALDFINDGISNDGNARVLHLRLLHWHPDFETEAYSQKQYMSIPLDSSFYEEGEDFDSVEVKITTYDGVKTYMFVR